ncbi:glycoside hydrolase family 114 protein, partial [Piromyces sp. E2]
ITFLVSTLLINVNAARWKPKPGLTWDYLLGGNTKTIKKNVVSFDLEYAEKVVPILHKKGQKAICYFSGGRVEISRPDDAEYSNSGLVIKERDDGYSNLLDIKNKKKLQPLIRKRFKRAYNYGCDGVEVDVLDLYKYYPEKFTKEDSFVFAKWVAETGHEDNISVGLKNLPSLAERLEPYFDFAIVESCVDYNECKYYKTFTKKNKAVFNVQY